MALCILLLTNRVPYPLSDGGALAMDALINGYAQKGAEVHLLAMNTSKHRVDAQTLTTLYPHIAGFYTVSVDNTVKTTALLRNFLLSNKPEHIARFQSAAFSTRLHELIISLSPNVVQLESPFLASYIPLIRQAAPKALVVYRMHNIEAQIWQRLASQSTGLKAFYLRNLATRIAGYEASLWRSADLLLPITNVDADTVKGQGIATPMQVAPFGITPTAVGQSLPPGPLKVYHVGGMNWLPNQEAIIWFLRELWPKLHTIAPELTFHFAGRDMPSHFFQNLPPGVFCEGEVPDAAAFASDKHILVVPLFAGGGIRIKILEAMAAGKLVISTAIGMQGIDAQSDLHYLRADDAPSFIRQLAWASIHPEKVNGICNRAQNLVKEHYDTNTILTRILRKIESMITQ